MNTHTFRYIKSWAVLLAGIMLLAGCSHSETGHDEHHHEGESAEAASVGPHGGRVLGDESFKLEVTLYETNTPPELRLYAYANGKPVAPDGVTASVELQRFGNRRDHIAFTPKGEYLLGDRKIDEPHSFDVLVKAQYAGHSHEWKYESYEGRTRIAADMAGKAAIETLVAGPGTINETVTLYGSIQPDAQRVRQVSARFHGVIRSVTKQLGDRVKAGEVLATVESNESLQTYAITAPQGGLLTELHANVGESSDGPLFVITDFSRVWAQLSVFPRDRAKLKVGQSVMVVATEGQSRAAARIESIVAGAARITLDNTDNQWVPGQFVTGMVSVAQTRVDIAVPETALQPFRDWTVVFLNSGDTYQAMPVQLGRRDGEWAQVVGGLAAGERLVSRNSYLIKADIEKSGAAHDH